MFFNCCHSFVRKERRLERLLKTLKRSQKEPHESKNCNKYDVGLLQVAINL